MPPEFETVWAKAPDFAEVAEALGVPTDHIIAQMSPRPGAFIAFYSQDFPPDLDNMTPEQMDACEVHKVALERDHDGILRIVHGPEVESNFWRGLREQMEASD